jgi:hypothetical protein
VPTGGAYATAQRHERSERPNGDAARLQDARRKDDAKPLQRLRSWVWTCWSRRKRPGWEKLTMAWVALTGSIP